MNNTSHLAWSDPGKAGEARRGKGPETLGAFPERTVASCLVGDQVLHIGRTKNACVRDSALRVEKANPEPGLESETRNYFFGG